MSDIRILWYAVTAGKGPGMQKGGPANGTAFPV